MIFQDPRAGINPMRTVGDHLTETMRLCEKRSAADARAVASSLLAAVRMPRPDEHLRQYPHELSGGMLQRVMIAGALTSSPRLLICDEPTTALDVTTQAEILAVLAEQRASRGMGMLFITHDLNLAATICDRVYVMSAGRVEEQGDARQVFRNPQAAYTKRLVAATPTIVVAGSEITTFDAAADVAGRASSAAPAVPGVAAGRCVRGSRRRSNRCSSRAGSRRPTCGEARSRCMPSSTHPSRSRPVAPSASSANRGRESRRSPA